MSAANDINADADEGAERDEELDEELDASLVVRTVTVFIPASHCTPPSRFTATLARAVGQAHALRDALMRHGILVQTTRVSAPGPGAFAADVAQGAVAGTVAKAALAAARELDDAPVDYASLGTVHVADPPELLDPDFLVAVIARTRSVALSVQLCPPSRMPSNSSSSPCYSASHTSTHSVSRSAVRAAAAAVPRIAALTHDGFSNLRFAAAAHIPPGGPFFPTSYAAAARPPATCNARATADNADAAGVSDGAGVGAGDGEDQEPLPAALGVQGATLLHAVVARAIENGATHALCRRVTRATRLLTRGVERGARRLVAACGSVCAVRVDWSTAPLPAHGHGVAAAIMRLAGPQRQGQGWKFRAAAGGLAAAARVADAIDRAQFPRAGFCGIMLPVSEDEMLARAPPGLHDLLVCSAVCGTGLDTVPVPGDSSEMAIARVLGDVAALSCRLGGKGLTARLMPVPGARAGERTRFDSPYFCNGPVVALEEAGGASLGEDEEVDGYEDEVAIAGFRARGCGDARDA